MSNLLNFCSHICLYCSRYSSALLSACGASVTICFVPSFRLVIRLAFSRIFKCLEMAAKLTLYFWTSSPTDNSVWATRLRMSRRVGSDRQLKTVSSCNVYSTIWLNSSVSRICCQPKCILFDTWYLPFELNYIRCGV